MCRVSFFKLSRIGITPQPDPQFEQRNCPRPRAHDKGGGDGRGKPRRVNLPVPKMTGWSWGGLLDPVEDRLQHRPMSKC